MFIKHTACPRCGSSDALALYQGGSSFCFSCRTNRRGNRSPYLDTDEATSSIAEVVLPSGCGFNYSKECLDWVFKYDITIEELIKNKVYWEEEKQQLIFTFYDEEGQLLLWQARNFWKGTRLKYYTKGKPETTLPIYRSSNNDMGGTSSRLVIVEDCISAIKIARQCPAMPVLGSSLSAAKLTRLSHLPGLSRAIVWLDGNMYDKAQAIARKLQMLGIPAKAVYTELDPKCLSNTEINDLLQSSC